MKDQMGDELESAESMSEAQAEVRGEGQDDECAFDWPSAEEMLIHTRKDPTGATVQALLLEKCVTDRERRIAELEAWKAEAMALLEDITKSSDESMAAEDKRRYLGRSPAFIIQDVFRRAHEAEKRIESRLECAFLRHIQSENNCVFSRTGEPCREKDKCGCWLEMEDLRQ